MEFCRIKVFGLVQGIGYRPFACEQAEELGLCGQVRNAGGIVTAEVAGKEETIDEWIRRLTENAPAGARVDRVERETLTEQDYLSLVRNPESFHIVESAAHDEDLRLLPPDLPTCPDCERELLDPTNRRYRYPFISCVACGPRFSIMKQIPYDRNTITMDHFEMCPACAAEYTEKNNRRRHAQTIACHDCGPVLRLLDRNIAPDGNTAGDKVGEDALAEAIARIKAGEIAAIKDIGGYHFAFRADLSQPASRLREFKNREHKPFAVMFKDLDAIREYCLVSEKEEELLLSPARPIVLLKKKIGPDVLPVGDLAYEVCGPNARIGAMLPCNPLQILLLRETGPLVMTSGNRGGEPIIIQDADMESLMQKGGPDFMLTHDREILTPLDDSIYQVTDITMEDGETRELVQIIRRARGLVPEPICLPRLPKTGSKTDATAATGEVIFAAGGDLKNSFALSKGDAVYLSGHFGDLEEVEAENARYKSLRHMEELLNLHPTKAVADRHPAYLSVKDADRRFGKDETLHVQHHYAHVASCIAEYGLKGPVLGISFDGTGYGDDGTIWGSEFLLTDPENGITVSYEKTTKAVDDRVIPLPKGQEEADETVRIERSGEYIRMGHLMPVKMLGGNISPHNAELSRSCYLKDAEDRGLIWEHVDRDEILNPEWHQTLGIALEANINTIRTSSIGRLFDAAASVLDLCHYNSYEGECPESLETAAHRAEKKWETGIYTEDNPLNGRYPVRFILKKEDGQWLADGARVIGDLRMAKDNGVPVDELALEFHDAVAEMTITMADKICTEAKEDGIEVSQIVLVGGTFLNRALLQRLLAKLTAKGYSVYVNEKVPVGDGGLALGQTWLAKIAGADKDK